MYQTEKFIKPEAFFYEKKKKCFYIGLGNPPVFMIVYGELFINEEVTSPFYLIL